MRFLDNLGPQIQRVLGAQIVKKASQSLPLGAANKVRKFSAGARTWRKIHLRLQVWNLSPIGGQIMRAAGCQSLSEKPEGVFRQSQPPNPLGLGASCYAVRNASRARVTGRVHTSIFRISVLFIKVTSCYKMIGFLRKTDSDTGDSEDRRIRKRRW